jgi:hypothetical protein
MSLSIVFLLPRITVKIEDASSSSDSSSYELDHPPLIGCRPVDPDSDSVEPHCQQQACAIADDQPHLTSSKTAVSGSLHQVLVPSGTDTALNLHHDLDWLDVASNSVHVSRSNSRATLLSANI